MLTDVEQVRLRLSRDTEAKRKSYLGQFLTPAKTAQFMAELFESSSYRICRLLDPGAGIGSLSSAFLERCISGELDFDEVSMSAFEIDELLHEELGHTLENFNRHMKFTWEIIGNDFIEAAVKRVLLNSCNTFTHVILNPPYRKINSKSHHRLLLRQVGIETVNLYSAFVALSLSLMKPGGQLVAIIPRSFCNGPYYRSFRKFMLERAAIRHMHLFASRSKAFKDDNVLQENLIILLERESRQKDVRISTSTDDSFVDLITHTYPFSRIVFPDDPEMFIHVPTTPGQCTIERLDTIRHSLDEIGIKVSTGPVVDFRVKEHLRDMPERGTVPLLYPGHFRGQTIDWPKPGMKKPNAIQRNNDTEKWLYPNGFYCVVRRFSSKEEKRRIMASVVRPTIFRDTKMLGFENHLNVFHDNKQGLQEAVAHGLSAFLNMSAVDEHFRRFNGHTQVNVTDLKLLKYPSRKALIALGEWAMNYDEPTQTQIDKQLARINL